MEDLNLVWFFLNIAEAAAPLILSVLSVRTGVERAFSIQSRCWLRHSPKVRALAAVGVLRNMLGDAHKIGPKRVLLEAQHAELAVDFSGTMATFLIATRNTNSAKTWAKITSKHAP